MINHIPEGQLATTAGGVHNKVMSMFGETVGGQGNFVTKFSPKSVIAGGYKNKEASVKGGVITGGWQNKDHGMINNYVGGGLHNSIRDAGETSSVIGGSHNQAGD